MARSRSERSSLEGQSIRGWENGETEGSVIWKLGDQLEVSSYAWEREDVKKIGEPEARDKKRKFNVGDEVGFSKVVLWRCWVLIFKVWGNIEK